MTQRDAPERVFEEMRDADDPESEWRELQQRLHRPAAHKLVREDDDVRPVGLDDL